MPEVKRSSAIALACAALLLGAGGGVAGTLALSPGESGPNTEAGITLPETVGGLRPEPEVVREVAGADNTAALEGAQTREEILAEAAAALSASRGGATAAAATYADDELEVLITIFAVADDSPRLWTAQETEAGPEYLKLATPMEWVEREGEAECLVRALRPLPAGSDAEEVEATVLHCQLRTPEVTVMLQPNGSLEPHEALGLLILAAAQTELD